MILTIILLLIGLAILIIGAEALVRGAVSFSKKVGIPPIVIGLTIVAFGTSLPELVVNLISAIKGTTGLALGNIIGSNIANILLILGISALIVDLKVQKNTVWKEIPFAVLAVLVIFAMANDKVLGKGIINILSRIDGFILFGFFAIFLCYIFKLARAGSDNTEQGKIKVYSTFISIPLMIAGLLFLFFGGQLLVNQAVILAKLAGLSEMFIGLTILAVGTSLPELATSAMAVIKGQNDIAIGNIVGSNIFNIFWVLGITGIIQPMAINTGANVDILVCLTATVALFLAMFIGKKHTLKRWQGGLFVISYIIYVIYLIQRG
ncbi:sodium:proton exchanger [Candidatus Kuenenbacteria bacterium RIFCSPHIGHO2_02_FULL_39_13]|uniref:Sodium:proton exchanger n=1 Tax=Candidatus Kuenenbacteria bacterium RIFCSPHIGHO2_02_FULL_39_13 TaxID=1798561 RepID=A0A1F6FN45_9BACT|nr:MAG: sodium:proton exchanger [Candidatus Kuenenbacteria bacterium RIFCSPHIGHO2_02_FULL_39_13]